MKPTNRFVNTAIMLVMLAIGGSGLQAASIIWNTPQNITADTNVSTQGTFNRAALISSSIATTADQTVNGVVFKAWTMDGNFPGTVNSYSQDNTTLATTGNNTFFAGNRSAYNTAPPSTTLSGNYSAVVSTTVNSWTPVFGNAPLSLTLNSLVNGQEYLFQAWINDPFGGDPAKTFQLTSGNTSAVIDANTTDVQGGLGQYITGTFFADSNPQVITWSSPGSNLLTVNAYQLRAIPEPSSLAMLGLSALGVFFLRRRRAA